MGLKKWGFVYTLGGDGEAERRDELGSEACRLVAVGVSDVAHAARVAVDLANDGCELIEFCGAFGATPMAEVIAALEPLEVPVGTVTYGGDATQGLHRIFG